MFRFRKSSRSTKEKNHASKAQTAIEYLLLLAIAAIVVFIAFNTLLPQISQTSNLFYEEAAGGIMGESPPYFPCVSGALDRADCAWTGGYREDHFDPAEGAVCRDLWPSRPLLCGRRHSGDEHGNTYHYCCDTDMNVTVTNYGWYGPYTESSHSFICPAVRPFMTGRVHYNDENGDTHYLCAAITNGEISDGCAWSGWFSENGGTWYTCPADRPFMTGRAHSGDETDDTRYHCCPAAACEE